MLRRILWIALALVLVVVALSGGLVAFAIWRPGIFKPTIERLASERLGREVRVEGPIRIDPGRVTTVEVEGLRIAAPDWAQADYLADVRRIRLGLDVAGYLRDRSLHLTEVTLDTPRVALERDAQGRTSWPSAGGQPDQPVAAQDATPSAPGALPRIDALAVNGGRLDYVDAPAELRLAADFATAGAGAGALPGLQVDGRGALRGDPIDLTLRVGSPGASGQAPGPVPVDGRLTLAGTEATLRGEVREPAALRGVDLVAELDSRDPRPLLRLAGRPVDAELPALKARARLVRPGGAFELTELRLGWADSAVEGELSYDPAPARPVVKGALRAPKLDLVPWWPAVMAGGRDKEPTTGNPLAALAGRDGEVTVRAGEVRLPPLTLREVAGTVRLADDRLILEPLRLGLPVGEIAGRIATGPVREEPLSAEVAIDLAGVDLAQAVRVEPPVAGVVDGRLTGDVRGSDAATLLKESRLRFEGRAQGLRAPYFQAQELTATAVLEDGRAVLDPLRAVLPDGRIEGRVATGPLDGELSLDGDLAAENARLGAFLGEDAPYAGAITGKLDGTLFVGSLDALLNRSRLRFDGRADGLRVPQAELGTLVANARLEEGRVTLDPVRADLPQGRIAGRVQAGPFGEGFAADLDLDARQVDLAALARSDAFAGVLDGKVTGKLAGNGVAELATRSRLELRGRVQGLRLPQVEQAVPDAQLDVSLDPGRAQPLRVVAEGRAGGTPLRLTATGGSAEAIAANKGDYPVTVEAKAGDNEAKVNGRLTLPVSERRFAADLELQGEDPSPALALFRLPKLKLPPYRVAANLSGQGAELRVKDLAGKVGDSDVGGDLVVGLDGPRPTIAGELRSKLVDADDFGGLIGAEPATGPGETTSGPQRQRAEAKARDDKVIPDEPLEPGRWRKVDLDLKVRAEEVRLGKIPLDGLDGAVSLQDGLLRLDPLTLRSADGRITGRVVADGRQNPLRANLNLDLSRLSVARLLSRLDVDVASFGTLSGRARGDVGVGGVGRSVKEILSNADGEVTLAMEGGSIDRTLAAAAGFDLLGVLGSVLGVTSDQVRLTCSLADLAVRDGVVTTRSLLVDTPVALVRGEGTIDLKSERIDLNLLTRPKRTVTVPTEQTGVTIGGTLANPDVNVNAAALAVRGVAAATLGVLAKPFATVVEALGGGGRGEGSDGRPGSARDGGAQACQRTLTGLQDR